MVIEPSKKTTGLYLTGGLILFLSVLCSLIIPGICAEIAPEKDIIVVGEDALEPHWKKMWDRGRELARNEQFEQAIPYYRQVLEQKPNIEEVKWELCRLYIEARRYKEASVLLDSLLEASKNDLKYLLEAGALAMLTGKANQAVIFYGQALGHDPGGRFYLRALEGMINGLVDQGKRTIAIPLMEQLYQSGGESPELLQNLALFLSQTGQLAKSHYYYQELINKYRVTPQLLRQSAYISEKLDAMDSAVTLWERYLDVGTESIDIRKKLTDYYLSEKKFSAALPHLLVLLEHDINREKYLLLAGKIYLLTLGRADKALGFYERYMIEFPQGENVSPEIENIRLILANDFLSIVENKGVWRLWTDLAAITPDRVGIYRAMANLLEALGKKNELIEVLQIINIHDSDDLDIRLKLASLYYTSTLFQKSLDTLNLVKNSDGLTPEYYLLRMKCEMHLKKDLALLASYRDYLQLVANDKDIRAEAITLAGTIGDIETIRSLLFDKKGRLLINVSDADTIINAAIDELIANQLFSEAEDLIIGIEAHEGLNDRTLGLLSRKRASINYLQEHVFAAEQQLRVLLLEFDEGPEIVYDLLNHAVESSDIDSARTWLTLAQEKTAFYTGSNTLSNDKSTMLYYKLRIYELSEESGLLRDEAHAHLDSKKNSNEFNEYDLKILNLLIKEYYLDRSIQGYLQTINTYSPLLQDKGCESILHFLVNTPIDHKDDKELEYWNSLYRQNSISELFEIFELLLQLRELSVAGLLLEHLEDRMKHTLRLDVLRAQLHIEQYQYFEAAEKYRALVHEYPHEGFYQRQFKKFEVYREDGILRMASSEPGVINEISSEKLAATIKANKNVEENLRTARLLWRKNNEKAALEVYEALEEKLRAELQPTIIEIKNSSHHQAIVNEHNWHGFTTSINDLYYLDYVMAASFFATHLTDELASVAARTYEIYRWLKLVNKERKAKQALHRQDFYQAERNYQELLQEEEVEDIKVYQDLATVYNRLGKYAKETELLEKIKEQKIDYPELQTVVDKSENRRRPQLFTDLLLRKEDGRGGDIDIKQLYFGLGLKIQPTIYQETGFRAGRNTYGNSADSSLLTSNFISAQYSLLFGNDVAIDAELGFEDIDEEGEAYVHYKVTLSGSLAKSVDVYSFFRQKLVTDTISAISEGIYQRDLQAGLTIDYLPRIFFGFNFNLREYSDNNDGKGIHLWSSYRLFSDLSNLDITYDYQKQENTIDSGNYRNEPDVMGDQTLGYWSPGNYWKHSLTAELKRELWPTGKRQSGSSYLAGSYELGYETGDNFIQQLKLEILLEISRSFLLKGTFASDWSDDYNRTQGYAAFVYRW